MTLFEIKSVMWMTKKESHKGEKNGNREQWICHEDNCWLVSLHILLVFIEIIFGLVVNYHLSDSDDIYVIEWHNFF